MTRPTVKMLPSTNWHARNNRLAAVAERAEKVRPYALRSLAAGCPAGSAEWLWWCFPGLAERCGCRSSISQRSAQGVLLGPSGADLQSASEGLAYLRNAALREGLLRCFEAVQQAMQQHKLRPPFAVLDAHVEGRTPDGEWARGPLGSFRLFCSATLFAALAHIEGDDEVKRAAVKTLRYFRPEDALVYRAGAPGTAGYAKEEVRRHTTLSDADWPSLELCSRELDWPDSLGFNGASADHVFSLIRTKAAGAQKLQQPRRVLKLR